MLNSQDNDNDKKIEVINAKPPSVYAKQDLEGNLLFPKAEVVELTQQMDAHNINESIVIPPNNNNNVINPEK